MHLGHFHAAQALLKIHGQFLEVGLEISHGAARLSIGRPRDAMTPIECKPSIASKYRKIKASL